jgi:trk system potassium uptake protein TrkH
LIPIRYKLLLDSYRQILHYFGSMMLVMCGLLLTPLLYLLFNQAELHDAGAFLFPALIALLLYVVFDKLIGKHGNNAMSYEEAAVSVSLTWIVMCALSAIPFMLLNRLSFSHAYFEAMSGYTTTGLTLIDFNTCTKMLFLWRSIMQYAGGAGIAIFLISLANGFTGAGLTKAEGKADLLVPQIRHSARIVMVIYSAYAVVGIIAYKIVGMGWFDSVIHTFAALSTGGFSTHYESIAWYKSVPIEAVSIALMLIGNLNFLNAYILFGGKIKEFLRNGEIKVQMVIIPLATVSLMLLLTVKLYGSVSQGFRIALFETVSALTTTGFTSTVYTQWSEFGLLVLTILMLIGGGTNSTAGGIKQYRLYFMYKSFVQILKEMTSPIGRIVRMSYWWGDKKLFISNGIIQSLFLFLTAYFGVYLAGVCITSAYGYSTRDAAFEFASALSNSGLSVGITTVKMPLAVIWTETIGMFLGRLEILIVFVAIAKIFRDGKRILV